MICFSVLDFNIIFCLLLLMVECFFLGMDMFEFVIIGDFFGDYAD